MNPIEDAAVYVLGSSIIYSATGYHWTLALGVALVLSALARYFYTEENK